MRPSCACLRRPEPPLLPWPRAWSKGRHSPSPMCTHLCWSPVQQKPQPVAVGPKNWVTQAPLRPFCTPGKVPSSGCCHSSASSSAGSPYPSEAWARQHSHWPSVGFSLPDFSPSWGRAGRALVFHSSLPPQIQLGQAEQVQAIKWPPRARGVV